MKIVRRIWGAQRKQSDSNDIGIYLLTADAWIIKKGGDIYNDDGFYCNDNNTEEMFTLEYNNSISKQQRYQQQFQSHLSLYTKWCHIFENQKNWKSVVYNA